jgi:hypothetical protein
MGICILLFLQEPIKDIIVTHLRREEARDASEHGPAGLELVLCVLNLCLESVGARAQGRRGRARRARRRGGEYAPYWRGRRGGAEPDSGRDRCDAHVDSG